MTKDEACSAVMSAISMALKDPVLQQGFEAICKDLTKLEKENTELKEKNKSYEELIDNGSTTLMKEKLKNYKQLSKAKEIIKKLKALYLYPVVTKDDVKRQDEILAEAEQFLKEVSE